MTQRFGPYLIEAEIGRGAAGVVYRARQAELDRPVALKLLAEGAHGPPVTVDRFRREALAAARLKHPNIVAVYDAGTVDGVPYLAMELVDGAALDLARMPLRARIATLAKVADAVHHAHEQGIVHRDLKPGNILVDRAGEPRIVDFGLAQVARDMTRLTKSGTAIGTPAYMSPEHVCGEQIGPHSDVFSLGVILYEALAGARPFDGETLPDIFHQIIHRDPPPPGRAPLPLATVCMKALDKNPGRRYATARDLAEDLRRWMRGEPVVARPPSVTYRLVRFAVRRRTLLAAAAGLAACAIVAAILVPRLRRAEQKLEAVTNVYAPLERDLDQLRMMFLKSGFELTDAHFARYEGLVRKLDDEMRRSGETAQGHYLIGRCYETIADRRRADDAYDRALKLDGSHASSLLALGRLRIEMALDRMTLSRRKHLERAPLARAEAAMELVRRGAGKQRTFEQDLAEAYVDLIAAIKDARRLPTEALVERWRDAPFVEEFILIDGLAAAVSGAPDDLEKAADAVIARTPSSYRAHFLRGVARGHDIEDYTRALRINPRYAPAHLNRGKARLKRGDLEAAQSDFDAAIRLDPRDAAAYVNRAALNHKRRDLVNAALDADKAIDLDPQLPEAHHNRALVHSAAGDKKAALDCLARALELDETMTLAYLLRANILVGMGNPRGALKDLDRAVAIDSAFASAYELRAMVRAADDPSGALADAERAAQLEPDSGTAHYTCGVLRAMTGDDAGAERAYDASIATGRAPAGAYTNRGNLRFRRDDVRGALADFDEAIRRDPESHAAYVMRAQIRAGAGRLDEALEDADRAVALAPKEAVAWMLRGSIRKAKGDAKGAAADFEKSLEVAPPDWDRRAAVEAELRRLKP